MNSGGMEKYSLVFYGKYKIYSSLDVEVTFGLGYLEECDLMI